MTTMEERVARLELEILRIPELVDLCLKLGGRNIEARSATGVGASAVHQDTQKLLEVQGKHGERIAVVHTRLGEVETRLASIEELLQQILRRLPE